MTNFKTLILCLLALLNVCSAKIVPNITIEGDTELTTVNGSSIGEVGGIILEGEKVIAKATFEASFASDQIDKFTLVVDGEETEVIGPFVADEGNTGLALNSTYSITVSSDAIALKKSGAGTVQIIVDGEELTEFEYYVISEFAAFSPLLVIIVLALYTQNVYIALFFGIWTAALITSQGDFEASFMSLLFDYLQTACTDLYNFQVILFTIFLGGFMGILTKSGGQKGLVSLVTKYATSNKGAQFSTVVSGLLLFFDDYTNALLVGSSFKSITDQFSISREKLAFLVDSTSAPIASLLPISSWIAFELSQIDAGLKTARELDPDNAPKDTFQFFLDTLPSRYYPWLMIVLQLVLIAVGREFGPMLLAERRCVVAERKDGGDGATDTKIDQDETQPEEDTPQHAFNFIVPVTFLIGLIVYVIVDVGKTNLEAAIGEYEGSPTEVTARGIFSFTDSYIALIVGAFGAALFAAGFYMLQTKEGGSLTAPSPLGVAALFGYKKADGPKPLVSFGESVEAFVQGMKNLFPTIVILCLAFTTKIAVTNSGADRLFTNLLIDSPLTIAELPTVIFVISSFVSWSIGSSWGTMSIMFPLVGYGTYVKAAGDMTVYTVAMSQILAGAVWGDHSSFISDTTILSSLGAGCDVTKHVYTQLPYALWGAVFSILFGTLPAGGGANAIAMLIVSMIILSIATVFVSAPVVSRSGYYDIFNALYLKIRPSSELQQLKDSTVKFAEEHPETVSFDAVYDSGRYFAGKYSKPVEKNVKVVDSI